MRSRQHGFSFIELLIAIAVAATAAAIAVPSYQSYLLRMRVSVAIADISKIALAIRRYDLQHNALPPDLNAIHFGDARDPWGNRYYYLPFDGVHGLSGQRKNKNLVPINSEYDLYSAGRDGQTRAPLTARQSRDDIIRANDGGFIGLASNY